MPEYRQHQQTPCEDEKQQQITDLDEGAGEFSLQIQVSASQWCLRGFLGVDASHLSRRSSLRLRTQTVISDLRQTRSTNDALRHNFWPRIMVTVVTGRR